jgi:phage terminase large subunit
MPLQKDADFDWKNPNYDTVYIQRSQNLERLRANPEILQSLKEFYKTHPAEFINDWGMTFDPRNVERGIPAVVPFLLFERQQEFIQWLHDKWTNRKDGLAEKSRDMGVSWLCVGFAAWMMIFHAGSVVGFGSRKEEYVDKIGDPKSLFWKVREFINFLPDEFKPPNWNPTKDAPFMRIINNDNKAAIVGEAGDNIGRGNRTSIYFKDESAFYEHADAVDAALSQTSNCKIDVSTPNGSGNPFYNKRHGGRIDVFVFDWKDDPRKDNDWYRAQCESLDPVIVAQEIDRNYESSVTNAFIPSDIVMEAMARGAADVQAIGGLRVGIDVARFGDDKSVITFRRGRVLLKQVILSKLDIAQVAGRARIEILAYNEIPEQIAVDTIGVGAGVADIMRGAGWYEDIYDNDTGKKRQIVVDINSSLRMGNGQDYNLRAFMWREMKEWCKTASLLNDPELKVDLTALKYHFKGGELLLESKDDAKRRGIKSPDRGDSLALTFAIPTIHKPKPKLPNIAAFQSTTYGTGMLG